MPLGAGRTHLSAGLRVPCPPHHAGALGDRKCHSRWVLPAEADLVQRGASEGVPGPPLGSHPGPEPPPPVLVPARLSSDTAPAPAPQQRRPDPQQRVWLCVGTRVRADCPGHRGALAAMGAPGTSSLPLVPVPLATAGVFLASPPPLRGASGSFLLRFRTQAVHCLCPSRPPSWDLVQPRGPLVCPPVPGRCRASLLPCTVGRRAPELTTRSLVP